MQRSDLDEINKKLDRLAKKLTKLKNENRELCNEVNMLTCIVGNTDGRYTNAFIREDNAEQLKKILEKGPSLLEDYRTRSTEDRNGNKYYSPTKIWLTFAAKLGSWNCVRVLADHVLLFCNQSESKFDAQPLANLRDDAARALAFTVHENQKEVVKLLTQINLVTHHIPRPILIGAIDNNHFPIFQLLVTAVCKDNGARSFKVFNFCDSNSKYSPFEYAASLPDRIHFVKEMAQHYNEKSLHAQLKILQTANLFNVLYNGIVTTIPTDFTNDQRKNMLQHMLTLENEQRNKALYLANDPTKPLGRFFANDVAYRKTIAEALGKTFVDVTIETSASDKPKNRKSAWNSFTSLFGSSGDSSGENEPFLAEAPSPSTSTNPLINGGNTRNIQEAPPNTAPAVFPSVRRGVLS